jgi:hypothetical protein
MAEERLLLRVLRKFFYFALSLLFTACAGLARKSEPAVVGAPGNLEGQWHGKALVTDRQNGKSSQIILEIIAREPSQLRMEILSSGLGVYLASLALNNDQVRIALAREKRFVKTKSDPDAFLTLIPVRLPPAALLDMLFHRPMDPKLWNCDGPKAGEINKQETCVLRSGGATITFDQDPAATDRKIDLSSPNGEVEMHLEASRSKVEIKPEIFELEPPRGYRVETR